LQGLLQTEGRKTIENLARAVSLPDSLRVEDVAQALQHFINQSPWDDQRISRRYQGWLAERLNAMPGVLVVDEFVFVKQGRHSVGVQRQFSAVLSRKINCQIAVALHHLSAAGFLPLALRLYLPRRWLEDHKRLDSAGVPKEARRLTNKTLLALELIEDAHAAGISTAEIAPGLSWGRTEELANSIQARGLTWQAEVASNWLEAFHRGREELQNELGLDHFTGRSWRGFHHHACLVVLAYALSTTVRETAVEGA
jgi:SRSO17 transposase